MCLDLIISLRCKLFQLISRLWSWVKLSLGQLETLLNKLQQSAAPQMIAKLIYYWDWFPIKIIVISMIIMVAMIMMLIQLTAMNKELELKEINIILPWWWNFQLFHHTLAESKAEIASISLKKMPSNGMTGLGHAIENPLGRNLLMVFCALPSKFLQVARTSKVSLQNINKLTC